MGRLIEKEDTDNHWSYGTNACPYGVGGAHWQMMGGFVKQIHTYRKAS